MATFRATVVFPMFTNLPEDVITNTFHYSELTPMGLAAAAAAATPKLADFYEAVYAGSLGMANYMNPAIAHVNWYDLSEPAPRAPLTLPLGATIPVVSSTLPTEVATVLSFQGDHVSGTPQARRRGRIYIGAVPNAAMLASSISNYPLFSSAWIAGIRAGANTHLLPPPIADLRWSVWSPTDGTATFVTNGWIDNSPDTQRRRGIEPSVRTLWP